MRHLSEFSDFLLESVVGEVPIYYSNRLRTILGKIHEKGDIASFPQKSVVTRLLSIESQSDVSDNCALIDSTDNDDSISFKPLARIDRIYQQQVGVDFPAARFGSIGTYVRFAWLDPNNTEFRPHWNEQRSEIKIGRYVKKLSVKYNWGFTDADIEKFVNLYKAAFNFDKVAKDKMQLVSGEDIRKWYLESRYESGGGSMNNSCMRYARCQSYLDIYVKNPEVCQMLILKVDDDHISGRALVWKLKTGKLYMDRAYTSRDSDSNIFYDYAAKNGWDHFRSGYKQMVVQLNNVDHDNYPYMDTFTMLNLETHTLHNTDVADTKSCLILQETSGGFVRGGGVWSEYHDGYYPEEDLVWCENVNSYVLTGEATHLKYRDEWAAPRDDIFWSDYHEESFFEDDVVRSESMEDYLYPGYDGVIEMNTNYSGDTDWVVKKRNDLYIEVNGEYYSKENYIKDPYNGEYHFIDEDVDGGFFKDVLKKKLAEEISPANVSNTRQWIIDELKDMLPKVEITNDIINGISSNCNFISGSRFFQHPPFSMTTTDLVPAIFGYLISSGDNGKLIDDAYHNRYLKYMVNYYNNIKSFCSDKEVPISKLKKYELLYDGSNGDVVFRYFIKISHSFDYELLGNDVYKRYLYLKL